MAYFSQLTQLDYNAFSGCTSLTSVIMPNSIKAMSRDTFRGCTSLNSVVLSTSLTSISAACFHTCGFEHLEIPNNITTLSEYAFGSNAKLKDVIFSANITTIGSASFWGCYALVEMIFQGATPPSLGSNNPLSQTSLKFPIYVPDESVSAYKEASSWSSYANRVKGISERPAS